MEKTIAQKLLDLGCNEWEKGDHHRIYLNREAFAEMFGFEYECYGTGRIKSAKLNGREISNGKATKILSDKIFFNVKTEKFNITPEELI